jgi:hypothetical protein
VNFVVLVTLFASAVDVFPRLVVVSFLASTKGAILVVAFGSTGAFGTLAAGLLSAASSVVGGALGVVIVVASGATALAET